MEEEFYRRRHNFLDPLPSSSSSSSSSGSSAASMLLPPDLSDAMFRHSFGTHFSPEHRSSQEHRQKSAVPASVGRKRVSVSRERLRFEVLMASDAGDYFCRVLDPYNKHDGKFDDAKLQ